MTVRSKLTLQFTTIVGFILLFIFVLIYLLSAGYRKSEFYSRLEDKALSTARMLLEVEEVDSTVLASIERKRLGNLIAERIVIFQPSGEIMYSTDPNNRLKIDSKRLSHLRKGEMLRFNVEEMEGVGLLYFHDEQYYPVFAGGIDKYGYRKVDNLRDTMIISWILSILIAAFAGWWYSGRALRPVAEMIREADSIQFNQLQERIGTGNGKDELAMLAMTFNRLLDRVEKSINTEKMFVANASHEIRNPLTVIISQLEVALLNERRPEEYQKTIQSVLDDIKDLNDVSNRLLVLAQVTQDNPAVSFIPVSIEEILLNSVDDYLRNNQQATIELDFAESASEKMVMANEPLLKKAFVNLIENGCKFGDNRIRIELSAKDKLLEIKFIDEGMGIPEKELEHIFEPFFRAKNTQSIRGHGIGLSLVKRIIEAHKGRVNVTSAPGQGSIFTITLPAS